MSHEIAQLLHEKLDNLTPWGRPTNMALHLVSAFVRMSPLGDLEEGPKNADDLGALTRRHLLATSVIPDPDTSPGWCATEAPLWATLLTCEFMGAGDDGLPLLKQRAERNIPTTVNEVSPPYPEPLLPTRTLMQMMPMNGVINAELVGMVEDFVRAARAYWQAFAAPCEPEVFNEGVGTMCHKPVIEAAVGYFATIPDLGVRTGASLVAYVSYATFENFLYQTEQIWNDERSQRAREYFATNAKRIIEEGIA